MIVVISHPKDPHAQRVVEHLQAQDRDVLLLDISELPEHATITIDYVDSQNPRLEFRPRGGEAVDLAATSAVWWRRPQAPNVAGVPRADAQVFAAGEWHEALGGLWELMPGPWMNPPGADEAASHKAFQLKVASEIGFRVPRTLMTSDPDRARRFIDEQGLGRTIFKTFACTYAVWRETRPVRAEELRNLDAVRVAPVIFQEFIPAEVDLRVTIIGEQIFAAAIDSAKTDYHFDFRMVLGRSDVTAIELPPAIAAQLLRFMRRLGLVYGAIDLRRTPMGEHVFLEINTAGEFLFVEERLGLPISRALADWLAAPRRRSAKSAAMSVAGAGVGVAAAPA